MSVGNPMMGLSQAFCQMGITTEFEDNTNPAPADWDEYSQWLSVREDQEASLTKTQGSNNSIKVLKSDATYRGAWIWPSYVMPYVPAGFGENGLKIDLEAILYGGKIGIATGITQDTVDSKLTYKAKGAVYFSTTDHKLYIVSSDVGVDIAALSYAASGFDVLYSSGAISGYTNTSVNIYTLRIVCSHGATPGVRASVSINGQMQAHSSYILDSALYFDSYGAHPFFALGAPDESYLQLYSIGFGRE